MQAFREHPLRVVAAIAILVLGIFFRLTHLGTKVYWHDEVYTSLWLSGVVENPTSLPVFDGRDIAPADILVFQHLHPESSLRHTIGAIARHDAQHPPLYYVLAWGWARWLDDSPAGLRALAALIGMLLLPATYWLCAEAFEDRRACWLGTLFAAVAPVHVLYAQEAREYSLWAVAVVTASAALLRAMRQGSAWSWALYGLMAILGVYSHGLFPSVMVAHAAVVLYVLCSREAHVPSRARMLIGYLTASVFAVALYAPWAWTIYHHLDHVRACTDWMKESLPLSEYGILLVIPTFVFATVDPWNWTPLSPVVMGGIAVTLLLIAAAPILSWRYPRRHVLALSVALIVLPIAVLAIPDMIWGGQRAISPRYHFPCYVGVSLLVVHLLTPWLDSVSRRTRFVGWATVCCLLTTGILSCAMIWPARTWWSKRTPVWRDSLPAVSAINANSRPLILSGPVVGHSCGEMIALAHLLEPRTKLRVIQESGEPTIPSGFTDVYLVNVSDAFVQRLGAQWRLEALGQSGFWHVLGHR